jgi:hypothetical protein
MSLTCPLRVLYVGHFVCRAYVPFHFYVSQIRRLAAKVYQTQDLVGGYRGCYRGIAVWDELNESYQRQEWTTPGVARSAPG